MDSFMQEIKEHLAELSDLDFPGIRSLPQLPGVGSIIEAVEDVVEEVTEELELKHESLRDSHVRLQNEIASGVKRRLKMVDVEFAVTKEYAMKSLITVAAWILSQSCNLTLFQLLNNSSDVSTGEPWDMLLSRGLYLASTCILVPIIGSSLRFFKTQGQTSLLATQVKLIQGALPMVFAWASKDFVGAIEELYQDGNELWFIFVVALGTTLFFGASATFQTMRYMIAPPRGSGVRFHLRDITHRFLALPCQASLAVGFAWNEVVIWFSRKVQSKVEAPLFRMMVQIVYFVIVSFCITAWTLHHNRRMLATAEEELRSSPNTTTSSSSSPGLAATLGSLGFKKEDGESNQKIDDEEAGEREGTAAAAAAAAAAGGAAPMSGSSPSSSSSKPIAEGGVDSPSSTAAAAKAKPSSTTQRTAGGGSSLASTSASASQVASSSLATTRQVRDSASQPSLSKNVSNRSINSAASTIITHIADAEEAAAWAAAHLSTSISAVFVDALGFVYAWALLDSLNAFFFVYLGGYKSISASPYQLVFAFALALTLLCTRYATILLVERRVSAWSQTSSILVQKSMTLNVGWAWANYCGVAIADAVAENSSISPLTLYWLCAVFAWLCVTTVSRRFEIEHRAWERNIKEAELKSPLVDFLPPPARDELVAKAQNHDEKLDALVHDGTTGKAMINGNLEVPEAIPSEGRSQTAPPTLTNLGPGPTTLGVKARHVHVADDELHTNL